ncbi:MAG: D-alanyl-D-alanine carboxypeptidase/D-alanyl-D-alanine-endopeptidase [Leptolyngbyaceae cyanobacterium]
MESRLARLFGGGLGLTASLSCLPAVALCPADLPQRLAAISVRPELSGARLGVQVETLSGTVVYSQEGDRFFVPASTLKLLTTAAALTVLGPDHTLPTTIMGASTATGRTALTVVGGGDPTISTASLDALAQQLAPYDLSLVEVLYGDESALPGAIVNPHWEWEDVQAGYGAPVNALILNENEIGLTLVPQQVGQPLQVVWDEPAYGEDWAIDNTSRTVEPNEAEFVRVGRELGRPTLRVGGQLIAGAEPETAAIAEPNPGLAFLAALQAALATQGIRVQQTHLSPPPGGGGWESLGARGAPA